MKARLLHAKDGSNHDTLWFWCPGCKGYHSVSVNRPGSWDWNGSEENPTISPSIKVSGVRGDTSEVKVLCHSFVTDGKIQFLSDCAHELAGQTVELPEIDL